MALYLLGLIWLTIGSLALAVYVWWRERSRRKVMERVIASGDPASARHSILLPNSQADRSSLKGKVLSRAPSVWAKNAGIQQLLIQAGHDGAQAPLVYALLRVVSLVAFPLVALLAFPDVPFSKRMMYVILAGFIG